MDASPLSLVQTPVEVASPRPAQALSPADLAELLGAFNEVTRRLQETHETLRAEVARLEADLREANEQIRRSERLAALGEMAAGIAHEVRNPLGSIGLYAKMLVEDLPDRPEQQQTARKIAAAVRSLDGIVGDVLAFARQTAVRAGEATVGDLFDGAVEACRDAIDRAGAAVDRADERRKRRGAASSRTLVRCDPALLRQALVNVVRNAAEAIEETPASSRAATPTITLDVERRLVRDSRGFAAPMLALIVRDTGPGLEPGVIERMFNPFFTTRRAGTGLGLAIVHRIVDAHGGRVAVRNAGGAGGTGPAGAVVELLLPMTGDHSPEDCAA